MSKIGQNGEKIFQNFSNLSAKTVKSESKRGQNGDKIVQKFHILSAKTIKKVGSKNAKIPKNSQFVVKNCQKSEQKWSKMTVYNDKINFLLNPFLTKKN